MSDKHLEVARKTDEIMPHSAASYLGLHCLLWHVCPKFLGLLWYLAQVYNTVGIGGFKRGNFQSQI